jgi:hypothetical protein
MIINNIYVYYYVFKFYIALLKYYKCLLQMI